jgi:hypothetical protein
MRTLLFFTFLMFFSMMFISTQGQVAVQPAPGVIKCPAGSSKLGGCCKPLSSQCLTTSPQGTNSTTGCIQCCTYGVNNVTKICFDKPCSSNINLVTGDCCHPFVLDCLSSSPSGRNETTNCTTCCKNGVDAKGVCCSGICLDSIVNCPFGQQKCKDCCKNNCPCCKEPTLACGNVGLKTSLGCPKCCVNGVDKINKGCCKTTKTDKVDCIVGKVWGLDPNTNCYNCINSNEDDFWTYLISWFYNFLSMFRF